MKPNTIEYHGCKIVVKWPRELCGEYEERAAIIEYDGNVYRRDAERAAYEEIRQKYKMTN